MVEEKDNNRQPGNISRRQFLKDAGIVVGGTAVSSAFFLSSKTCSSVFINASLIVIVSEK